jgi:hypothetical protein
MLDRCGVFDMLARKTKRLSLSLIRFSQAFTLINKAGSLFFIGDDVEKYTAIEQF